jgi:hypothetical protein
VQRSREQLFARAALPFEQHRRIRSGRTLQRENGLLQRRRIADDLRRPAPRAELFLQQDVLRQQLPLCQRALDHQQQVIGIDRLGQKVEGAVLHGGNRILNAPVRRHDDDRQLGVELFRGPQHAKAVAFGQAQVRQHERRAILLHHLHRVALGRRFDDLVSATFDGHFQHRAERVFVFDDEDGRTHGTSQRNQPDGADARRASSSMAAMAFVC